MRHILDDFNVQVYVLIDGRLTIKAMVLVHCRLLIVRRKIHLRHVLKEWNFNRIYYDFSTFAVLYIGWVSKIHKIFSENDASCVLTPYMT
jgi:hypothetical protein